MGRGYVAFKGYPKAGREYKLDHPAGFKTLTAGGEFFTAWCLACERRRTA